MSVKIRLKKTTKTNTNNGLLERASIKIETDNRSQEKRFVISKLTHFVMNPL